MERRYLAATIALAATFAVFSGEFCTRYLSKIPHTSAQAKADVACAKQYVVQQVLAKLESAEAYIAGRKSDQPVALAGLSVPEMPEIPTAVVAPAAPSGAACPLQRLQHKLVQPDVQVRVFTENQIRRLNDLSVVRAELLSERAQEMQVKMNDRQMTIEMKALENAQRVSAHAMERAQREIEKSHRKMNVPTTSMAPIHINFVTPKITVEVPEVPTPTSF